jgi:hypothetical protein
MISATITATFRKPKLARSIKSAVSPDNQAVPQGLDIKMHVRSSQLIIHLLCERPLDSAISTLEDILSCISAAQETLERIGGD